jgi:PAS domain S-box-containing protein
MEARPIRDAQGAVVGARWQIRDVREQLAQAQALRESEARLEQRVAERTADLRASEERFRLVLQDSPVVVFQQDTDLRYTWIYNPAGGFSAEEVIGKTEHELLDQKNADRLAAFKRRVFETGQGLREEIPWEHNNETRWFDMKLEPLRDADGTIIGLTAVSTDITEYHREVERQRFLDEASSLLITSLDPGSLLRQMSKLITEHIADCCAFALPAENGEGGISLHTVYHPDPARAADLRAWLEQGLREQPEQHPFWLALRGTQTVYLRDAAALAVGSDQRGTPPDAQATPPAALLAISLIARGEVIGVLGLLNDQQGRYSAPQDLRMAEELARRLGLALDTTLSYDKALHARADAEAALKMRDQVFQIITHDLKTPLTTIHGYIYLMRRKLEQLEAADTEKLYRDSEKIDAAVVQMTQHIDELLHVARLQAGERLNLDDPIDLCALVQRIAETHQQLTEAHTIRVQAPHAGLAVRGDRRHLERVFSNLLSNAVKYSPQGGTVDVILTPEERDTLRGIRISICDEGVGIPTADLPYLFEPFRRGSNVKEFTNGTGLGLVSVRYIVEQHGGTITVESQEGHGSTFIIWLPLHEELYREQPAPLQEKPTHT